MTTLDDAYSITVMLTGIRAPSMRAQGTGEPEAFADEARQFVEARLLQREVELYLDGLAGQAFMGTIRHPVNSPPR